MDTNRNVQEIHVSIVVFKNCTRRFTLLPDHKHKCSHKQQQEEDDEQFVNTIISDICTCSMGLRALRLMKFSVSPSAQSHW